MEVTVAYSTDENFVKYLCVSVISLIEHSSSANTYRIIVLTDDISEASKDIIRNLGKDKGNIIFEFVNCTSYFPQDLYVGGLAFATYYRFMLLDMFPNTDNILYLDCDTIILTDVAELFEINLTGYYLAAVRDLKIISWCQKRHFNTKAYLNNVLKLKDISNYVNSGVLLINLAELRKDYNTEKLINIAKAVNYQFCDQDVFNIIAQGKIYFLDFKWNFFGFILQSDFVTQEDREKYEEAEKDIAIIHYAGNKPWDLISQKCSFCFWKYAFVSPEIKAIWNEACKNNDYRINDMRLNEMRVVNGVYSGKIGFKFYLRLAKAVIVGPFRRFKAKLKKNEY